MGLKAYGIEKGCQADLVILDASSVADAIITQANKSAVIKKGKVIVENIRETKRYY
jgi:cytosine deaminase